MLEIVEVEIGAPGTPAVVTVVAGFRGPAGSNGVGGADISAEPENAIEARANGLFVPQSQDLGTFN